MITAKLSHLRISPRKVRLVANLIKGLNVAEAEKQLRFLPKKSAKPLLKLLTSAIANALHNKGLAKEGLVVTNVLVNAGPSLKRWRPRAMGRAFPILKRTSHVTIILDSTGRVGEKVLEKNKIEEKEFTTKKQIQKHPKKEIGLIEKEKSVIPPKKPYSTTSQSKKKFFSRQTFGNVKKLFRRKSI